MTVRDLSRAARVVVIDDDTVHLQYVTTMLTCAGYAVRAFGNSSHALHAIDREPPDVVITDIVMPVRDGFEVLHHVRARHPSVPVVTMGDIVRGHGYFYLDSSIAQGAAEAMRKPVLPAELLATIQRLIGGSRPSRALGKRSEG